MANLPKTDFSMKASLSINEPRRLCSVLKKKNTSSNKILHDGPPYANGSIHIGHGYNKILKDFYSRANNTSIIPGWDCHGLPIENSAKKDKTDLPLKEKCRTIANKFSQEQRKGFERLGILMDDSSYKTMDDDYKLIEYSCLKKLYRKGFLSRQEKPVHYCNKDRTVLAFSELEYKSSKDTSAYFLFKTHGYDETYILCWTTTPWSIPANQAVGFSNKIQYVKFERNNKTIICSETFAKNLNEEYTKLRIEEIQQFTYTSHFLSLDCNLIEFNVEDGKGTGFVHLAPSHGEEDYLFCKKNDILPNTDSYKFTKNLCESSFESLTLESNRGLEHSSMGVIAYLKENGLLFDTMMIEHDVSVCWRCKTPTIRVALKQTFISFQNEIGKIIDVAKKINFVPSSSRNRFMSFLGNRTEWCISRQRKWGLPIPMVKNILTNEERFLDNLSDSEFLNWDNYVCEDGWEKIEEIVDVWFDSGVSHQMFGKQIDIIIEGSDQHRGWFQSSHILNALLSDEEEPLPFTKTIVTHGFVLDGDGDKQSKSKGNVVSPEVICNTHGADIFRLWVLSQSLDRDAKFGDSIMKDISDSYRKIRNNIRYLLGNLHDEAKPENGEASQVGVVSKETQDKIDLMEQLINTTFDGNNFDPSKLYSSFVKFSHELSAWFDSLKEVLYEGPFDAPERRQIQVDFRALLNLYQKFCFIVLPFTYDEVLEYI